MSETISAASLKEEHSDYVFAEAAVIGRDAAGRFGTVTLNKGSINDIRVNDPVIYGEYLVGVVASVTPTQCTVNTILNPNVNVRKSPKSIPTMSRSILVPIIFIIVRAVEKKYSIEQ